MSTNARNALYGHSLALLTDLYQLTMAQGYLRSPLSGADAVFHLFYRNNPFGGGYCVAAGLESAVQVLDGLQVAADDVEYLRGLEGNDGRRMFSAEFLDELGAMRFRCDVDAVPEGTVVFPHEPLVRVRGPIWQCQIVETLLLNIVNFQTLIATRASRICQAAGGDPVLEFGLRRAQGIDGGVSASRAAYIGGCAATSNVLAGKLFGIPVKGTHAHSWVMSFGDELAAFEAYAEAMPNNCVFLVDTYDTISGVENAITVGNRLRERGFEMAGIRLDSGDLAWLSIVARRLLDAAGFEQAAIVASNDLDEFLIEDLKRQDAEITVWGVGTKLATAYDQPALGGVYKLSAIRLPGQDWEPRIKLSEQAVKVSNPGTLQVRRFRNGGEFTADVIFDEQIGITDARRMVDPLDATRQRSLPESDAVDLLQPIFRAGDLVYECPPLHTVRERAAEQLRCFHRGVRRFVNPHQYPVGLEAGLHELRTKLILAARGLS